MVNTKLALTEAQTNALLNSLKRTGLPEPHIKTFIIIAEAVCHIVLSNYLNEYEKQLDDTLKGDK